MDGHRVIHIHTGEDESGEPYTDVEVTGYPLTPVEINMIRVIFFPANHNMILYTEIEVDNEGANDNA